MLRAPLMVLHALAGAIAAIPEEVSDRGVAARTLAWWREALADDLPHPALQAARATGVFERIPRSALMDLIDQTAIWLEGPRFETNAQWVAFARTQAEAVVRCEALLVDPKLSDGVLASLVAAGGAAWRARRLRDLVQDARADRWWVPLEHQAAFQVTRQEVVLADPVPRLSGLIRHLADEVAGDLQQAMGRVDARDAWTHRHLWLRWVLDAHLVKQIRSRPADILSERLATTRWTTPFLLWLKARKLRNAVH